MQRSDFSRMTGIYPSWDMFKIILMELEYQKANGMTEEEFCQNYKENKDGLAEMIQKDADRASDAFLSMEREKDRKFSNMSDYLDSLSSIEENAETIEKILDKRRI